MLPSARRKKDAGTHTPIVFPAELRRILRLHLHHRVELRDVIRQNESWLTAFWVTPLPDLRMFWSPVYWSLAVTACSAGCFRLDWRVEPGWRVDWTQPAARSRGRFHLSRVSSLLLDLARERGGYDWAVNCIGVLKSTAEKTGPEGAARQSESTRFFRGNWPGWPKKSIATSFTFPRRRLRTR